MVARLSLRWPIKLAEAARMHSGGQTPLGGALAGQEKVVADILREHGATE